MWLWCVMSNVFRTLRSAHIFAVLLLSLVVAACSPAQPPSVESVTTTLDASALLVGDTAQADATVVVALGASPAVIWSSSNSGVATVDSFGVVTAVGAGVTSITATSVFDDTKSGSATLTSVANEWAGRTVLYYNSLSRDTNSPLVALDGASLTYGLSQTIADGTTFLDELAKEPDLVVYLNQGGAGFGTGHLEALKDWVAGGGHLVFTHWDSTDDDAIELAAALMASFDGTSNYDDLTILRAELAAGLSSNSLPLTSSSYLIYDVGLKALDGGTAFARHESSTSAAIVSGNAGRTMMLGFMSGTLPDDDGAQLYTNIFSELLRNRFYAAP